MSRQKRRPSRATATTRQQSAKAQSRHTARRTPRRSWIPIAGVLGALVALIAIALSVAASQSDTSAAVARDPQTVAAGAELFAANCATCHGADLSGTDTGPPFLNVIYAPNHHADEAFQRAVVAGVVPHHWTFGPMAPIDGLSREDVALIVEYIRSEQEAAGILRDPSHP